jgi:hypothetical protein
MQLRLTAIFAISCVLLVSGFAQSANPGGAPGTGSSEKQPSVAVAGSGTPAPGNPSAVGMDQSVITLKDGCLPVGNLTPAKDCISDVTRAQFEKLTNALQPGMTADAKRGFASNYGKLLVYADAARALNLENNPDVLQIIQFVSNQVLAEGLKRHYAEQYSHLSDQQIQDSYHQNLSKYLEVALQRIIVPHRPGPEGKPAVNESEEKTAAEKIRQQWMAGGDPVKLQQAAFQAAGVTGPGTPDIEMGARKPGSLPVNQESVFQLKAGEVSQVYSDAAASYIYKAVTVRVIPLSEVKDSIVKTLQQQLLQEKLEEIGKSATPVLNETYFGPAAGPEMPAMGGRPAPNGAPAAGSAPK